MIQAARCRSLPREPAIDRWRLQEMQELDLMSSNDFVRLAKEYELIPKV